MGCGKSKHAVATANTITMKKGPKDGEPNVDAKTNVDPNVGKDIVETTKETGTNDNVESLPVQQESEKDNKKEDVSDVKNENKDEANEEGKAIEEDKGKKEAAKEKEDGDVVKAEQQGELASELSMTTKYEEAAAASEISEYSSPHPSEIGKNDSVNDIEKLGEASQSTGLAEEEKTAEAKEDEPESVKEENVVEEAKAEPTAEANETETEKKD